MEVGFLGLVIAAFLVQLIVSSILCVRLVYAKFYPTNSVEQFNLDERGDRPIVAVLGDSLSHGSMGFDWVNYLQRRSKGFRFVKVCQNHWMAQNGAEAVDSVVAMRPDYVVVLIGTHDAHATLSPFLRTRYKAKANLRKDPSKRFFQECYGTILDKLLEGGIPPENIAPLTLPPIGEHPSHDANLAICEFNTTIEQLCSVRGLRAVPLYHKFAKPIAKAQADPDQRLAERHDTEAYLYWVLYPGLIKHYYLRFAFDKLSLGRHGLLFWDDVHFNSVGGQLTASLVHQFLSGKLN